VRKNEWDAFTKRPETEAKPMFRLFSFVIPLFAALYFRLFLFYF